jgi:hypothetical protein
VAGKTFHGIHLFGILVKLVNNVSEDAAAGGKDAVSHVGSKLPVRLFKVSGNFV